jgi:CBS domain-containing protein
VSEDIAQEVFVRAKEIMSRGLTCCTPDASLQEVARAMVDSDCGEIPVVDSKQTMRPVGVVTDRDIACRTVAQGRNPLDMTASECMTSPCVSVTPDSDVEECCRVMEESQIRRLLVVDEGGRCVGVLAQADIARHMPKRETGRVVGEVSRPRGHSWAGARL